MYSDTLLDHFRNPRNAGELPPPALCVEVINPACGDTLRLTAVVENARVSAAAFKIRGCTASIACGSILTELILGQPVDALGALQTSDVERAAGGLPPESHHAAQLAIDGLRRLLQEASRRV